jgi:hypothetical protein
MEPNTPLHERYTQTILQNSGWRSWAKKIIDQNSSNMTTRFNSLFYSVATNTKLPFMKVVQRDHAIEALEAVFNKENINVNDMEQYIHDQYFLAIINDQSMATAVKRRLSDSDDAMRNWIVQAANKLRRKHALKPLPIRNIQFLIKLIREHYAIDPYETATAIVPTNPTPVPTKEQPAMSNDTAFQTKHFVYGHEIKTLTDTDLITAIKNVEKEIDNLRAVKSESKKITQKIDELDKQRLAIIEQLDAR